MELYIHDLWPIAKWNTVKVVIFARVIFRASAIFDIFACF